MFCFQLSQMLYLHEIDLNLNTLFLCVSYVRDYAYVYVVISLNIVKYMSI